MSKLKLKRKKKFRLSPALNFSSLKSKFKPQLLSPSWQACIPLAAIILLAWGVAAVAAPEPTVDDKIAGLTVGIDTMWVTITGFLVMFMNAGFCMLETGMCRQKNAVNVLSKNLIVFALSTIAFWAIGFGLMFGNGNGYFGTEGLFFLTGADNSPALGDAYQGAYKSLNWTGIPLAAKFFFQLVFAGTAATIVSGAVAERIKFVDFLVFSLILVGLIYPIPGNWIWGGGWLAAMTPTFRDFAGSTVVHSVGGWAALMGAAFLGPRLGRYNADGSANAMPGHNMSIATLGCLILWLGWFGFNPGSNMGVGDGQIITHIILTTNTGGAFGGIAATIVAWMFLGKPDLSMIINGILAGLVSVTAGCASILVWHAAVIGAIGGILVVFAVGFFDKLKIDDPVGAVSVHLINGVWGTFAVGLFAMGDGTAPGVSPLPGYLYAGPLGLFNGGGFGSVITQLVGILSVGGFTVVTSSILWIILKSTMGIRVSPEEEMKGLDISEHGMEAYSGFLKEEGR